MARQLRPTSYTGDTAAAGGLQTLDLPGSQRQLKTSLDELIELCLEIRIEMKDEY